MIAASNVFCESPACMVSDDFLDQCGRECGGGDGHQAFYLYHDALLVFFGDAHKRADYAGEWAAEDADFFSFLQVDFVYREIEDVLLSVAGHGNETLHLFFGHYEQQAPAVDVAHHVAQTGDEFRFELTEHFTRGFDEHVVVKCSLGDVAELTLCGATPHTPCRYKVLYAHLIQLLLDTQFALIGDAQNVPKRLLNGM